MLPVGRRTLLTGLGATALAGASGLPLRRARAAEITVGFIYVGPKDDYGYNQAHAEGVAAVKSIEGVTIVEEENVPETVDVEKTMESMIGFDGASLLFPTSFGYFDPHMLKMCAKYPDVQFRHCGGLWSADKHPKNAGSYFGYIGMAQYLNGVVAGHMSKTKKLGFVAAKPIPQVLINVNSFTLGARSVDPSITTQVIFTGEWSMAVKEAEATNSLVDAGVDVITCHVDGPKVTIETAERRGIYTCGYHADQSALAPKGYLTGAEWNWGNVYRMFIEKALAGEPLPSFVRGGLADGFVKTSPYGPAVSDAARKQADDVKAKMMAGQFVVYAGPLKNNGGKEVIPAGASYGEQAVELESTDWLVEGVVGSTSFELVSAAIERMDEAAGPSLRADLVVRAKATAEAIVIPLLALLGSAVIFALLVAALGKSPWQLFDLMYRGAFGTWFSWQNTLQRAAPLLLTALCVAVPARLGLVIIGGEGALALGGLAAAAAAIPLQGMPAFVVLAGMALAGIAIGAFWIGLAGALRHYRGVNETISSLLLAYIAIALMNHIVEGPLRDPASLNKPSTAHIGEMNMLGTLPGMDVHLGLVAGLVACVALWLLMDRTTFGFSARMTGGNVRAAMLMGLPVGRLLLTACAIGGACAGLAGAIEVAAVHGRANASLVAGYGYAGILVAFLARHNPLAIIPVAIFLGGIDASGGLIQRRMGLPDATVMVLQGIIFVMILLSDTLYGRFRIFRAEEAR